MTIEAFIIEWLSQRLSVPVSGSVPHPLPDRFVTVEKTGGRVSDHIPAARLRIQSWGTSRADAAALGAEAEAAVRSSVQAPEISRAELSASYNDTDRQTEKPRSAATFEIIYLFEEAE